MTGLRGRYNKVLFEIGKIRNHKRIWPAAILNRLVNSPAEVTIMSLRATHSMSGVTCCTDAHRDVVSLFNPEEATNNSDKWSERFHRKDYLKTWYLYGDITIRGYGGESDVTYSPSDYDKNGNLML